MYINVVHWYLCHTDPHFYEPVLFIKNSPFSEHDSKESMIYVIKIKYDLCTKTKHNLHTNDFQKKRSLTYISK